MRHCVKWSDKEKEYLKEITPGHHYAEIVELMNKKFDREFTVELVKNAIGRYKLNTGFNGRFEKGLIPHNKGQKGVCAKGAEKGWFKKGQTPINHKSVGSERITKDGYIMIKVAEPNKWRLKHVVEWEKHNGKLPRNHALIFLDRNKQNTSIDNLKLVSRSELLIINRDNLLKDNKELNETAVIIAKVTDKVQKVIKKGERINE